MGESKFDKETGNSANIISIFKFNDAVSSMVGGYSQYRVHPTEFDKQNHFESSRASKQCWMLSSIITKGKQLSDDSSVVKSKECK